MGRSVSVASNALTITNVPLGGYADVFTSGDSYKAVGSSIPRSVYTEMSKAFPRKSTYSANTITLSPAKIWYGMAYGNGIYVTVGANNSAVSDSAATSTDGVNWTPQTFPIPITVQSITYGNGLFVAVGSNGGGPTTACATSPDGVTWTVRDIPRAPWASVVYSSALGLFVAIGGNYLMGATSNVCATSPDGITWTQRTIPTTTIWTGLAVSPTGIVAVSTGHNAASTAALFSADGITWTAKTIPSSRWYSVAYGNGVFVANGFDGATTATAATSTDGLTWTLRVTNGAGIGNPCSSAYGNGVFIAVYGSSTSAGVITSTDGITWALRTAPTVRKQGQITYGAGVFVMAEGHSASTQGMTIYTENNIDSDYMYISGTAGKHVRVK